MKPNSEVRCVAGILVGGQSSRMGRPKPALLLPNGRTLVEHVANTALLMGSWVEEVVILGQCTDMPASLANLRVLPDAETSAGPLVGLCSLLEYAKQRWTLLLACDMPQLSPVLLERLFSAVHPDYDAVVFHDMQDKSKLHACCALYHPRLLPAAIEELGKGRRSLHNLLTTARVVALDPNHEEQSMLMNLNTSADYDRLLNQS